MQNADAVVILTEWNEFRALDFARMHALLRQPVLVDLRNIYRPEDMKAAGFIYMSVGRKPFSESRLESAEASLRELHASLSEHSEPPEEYKQQRPYR